tara:strand:+ start:968 stop:1264 length:297 start_codon:yes stop_codon:yes gene_type:complete
MIITINQVVDFCREKWGEDWCCDDDTYFERIKFARKEIKLASITINQVCDFCREKWGEDWTWDEGSTIKEKMNYARKEIARKDGDEKKKKKIKLIKKE